MDLGEHFRFNLNKSTANKNCVFKGDKYRITVLTERLVRLEYNAKGIFEDYPTELVWYRNFAKPEFTVEETNKQLRIKTSYFDLSYRKEKKFNGGKLTPTRNLKITLVGNEKKYWYYHHPEARNLGASTFNVNDTKNKKLKRGLYSLDGFVSIDDSKSSIILENGTFKKRDSSGVDIYVFLYNQDFYYCLNDYFMITGFPPMIPRFALGNWWDKDDAYTEMDIAHLIKKFEDYKIPISTFILNNWQDGNNFEFNKTYKEPGTVIPYLNSKHIQFGLAINYPETFEKNSLAYNRIKPYLSQDKNGNIPLNVFDSRCIEAFLKILIHSLDNLSVDLYSIESFDESNLERQAIFKHFLYIDGMRADRRRPIISAPNYRIASHRYPILYTGKTPVSWDTLKKMPSFNAKASNIGVSFWSSDVGGSSGGVEDSELFVRFVQLATFSPILRLGSDGGKYYKREPWKWGLKPREITIDFLNLRHKLIPYLYTESYKYFKYGKPLIEPIYYKNPALYDSDLYRDEYFLGSTLFVCPITEKKNYILNRVIHKIYFPEGVWYDYFTGKQFKGNRKYVTFYRDQGYPVFVKAGSIIPLSLNEGNDTSVPKNMEVVVFPGASNTYSIYEDDGCTNKYLSTEYLITNVEFVYQKDNYKLTILPVGGKKGVILDKRNYKIRFKNTLPTSIVTSYIGSNRVSNHCYKEDTDLIVEVSNVPTSGQLTVVVSGNNIEIEAIRIINEDITAIISDLPVKTAVKERIDKTFFNTELDLKKKRIEIRKLAHGKDYLERKYIDLLLKLLEYSNEV